VSGQFERRMMARVLELAARARGKTSPNPLVGAVVIKEGRVIGEGYHRRAGLPHAEVSALERAGPQARGATLLVNLEPCIHYGRTPPCVDAIIKAGIKRVVVAMRDPNPLVRGRGINALRRAGIQVEVGLMAREARELNEVFIHHITTGNPFVALKLAQSLDGGIALKPGKPTAITSFRALRLTHRLRSWHDAVLVGISTVIADDPLLNVRSLKGAVQPVRVVLDTGLKIPLECRLVATAKSFPTLLLYDPAIAPVERLKMLEAKQIKLVSLKRSKEGFLPPEEVLERLAQLGITSVLVEGGRQVATSFLRHRLIQRLHLFISPMLMGEGGPLHGFGDLGLGSAPLKLRITERRLLGPDIYLSGRIDYPAP